MHVIIKGFMFAFVVMLNFLTVKLSLILEQDGLVSFHLLAQKQSVSMLTIALECKELKFLVLLATLTLVTYFLMVLNQQG